MVERKPSHESELFFSCYDPHRGSINRTLTFIMQPMGRGRATNPKNQVRILTKPTHRQTWLHNRPGILKKIHANGLGVTEIMEKLNVEYIEKLGQTLIAAQLNVDGKKESWISPWANNLVEKYENVRTAEKTLKELRNNGAASSSVRFFERLVKCYDADIKVETGIECRGTCQLLESEVNNFGRPFNIWI